MKAKNRGRSKEDWVPVLTVRDRGKHTYEAIIPSVSTEQLNKELLQCINPFKLPSAFFNVVTAISIIP